MKHEISQRPQSGDNTKSGRNISHAKIKTGGYINEKRPPIKFLQKYPSFLTVPHWLNFGKNLIGDLI
jgi:hypothetical protein